MAWQMCKYVVGAIPTTYLHSAIKPWASPENLPNLKSFCGYKGTSCLHALGVFLQYTTPQGTSSFATHIIHLFAMVSTPELKKYMDKNVLVLMNGSRKIAGVLRGFDIFLNVVIDNAIEMSKDGSHRPLGSQTVIRGNSIVSLEALDTIV